MAIVDEHHQLRCARNDPRRIIAPKQRGTTWSLQCVSERVWDALCVPNVFILDGLMDPAARWATTAMTAHVCPGHHDRLEINGSRLRLGEELQVGDLTIHGSHIIVCLTVAESDRPLPYHTFQVFSVRAGRIMRVQGFADAREALAGN